MGNSRLRLLRQSAVQRQGIHGVVEAVAEHLDQIDAVAAAAGGGRVVVSGRAATVAARCGRVAVGRRDGRLGAGACDGRRGHGDPAAVGLRRGVVERFARHVERDAGDSIGGVSGHDEGSDSKQRYGQMEGSNYEERVLRQNTDQVTRKWKVLVVDGKTEG